VREISPKKSAMMMALLPGALLLLLLSDPGAASTPKPPTGNATAVGDLLERILPGSSDHFVLELEPAPPGAAAAAAAVPGQAAAHFTLADAPGGKVKVTGMTASDLSAGVGAYLMDFCNLTFGWPRGGGQHIVQPQSWPTVGSPLTRTRSTPWSYIMNVCTHSYSLVWYGWKEWEAFIDWQALLGINLNLAMTGQVPTQRP